jgi:hypothetical protein
MENAVVAGKEVRWKRKEMTDSPSYMLTASTQQLYTEFD